MLLFVLRKIWGVAENPSRELTVPKKILVVRQHNQLGDLLACVSVFRALKETYPTAEVSVLVSPANQAALAKNKYIDNLFVFDKKLLLSYSYFKTLRKFLKNEYDLAIVPVTVSISFTSNLLCRLAKAKVRIGPNSLSGKVNASAFFFDRRIDLDWRKYPDANVSDFSLDILRPFGIVTENFNSEISYDAKDELYSKDFLKAYKADNGKIIGLHVGAGKPPNRWSFENFINLINLLEARFHPKIYLTGSNDDKEIIDAVLRGVVPETKLFLNKSIPQVAALIANSDLFITNDTGIMHVAGATPTPQISLFGPTNPFNWAPNGKVKHFIRHSDLVNEITVEEVFNLASAILEGSQTDV